MAAANVTKVIGSSYSNLRVKNCNGFQVVVDHHFSVLISQEEKYKDFYTSTFSNLALNKP